MEEQQHEGRERWNRLGGGPGDPQDMHRMVATDLALCTESRRVSLQNQLQLFSCDDYTIIIINLR